MAHYKKQKGFTLIEILVAITIFAILMTTISTSYIYIARAQRETNVVREIYSEVRYIFNVIGDEARSKTIDYGCPRKFKLNTDDFGIPIDQGSTSNVCSDLQTAQKGSYLALVDRSATERVIFKVEDDMFFIYREEKGSLDPAWKPTSGYESGFVEIDLKGISIEEMEFEISPKDDPFDVDNIACGVIQFQPSVTVKASIVPEDANVDDFSMDLQTSFSSRVYNQQTNNL